MESDGARCRRRLRPVLPRHYEERRETARSLSAKLCSGAGSLSIFRLWRWRCRRAGGILFDTVLVAHELHEVDHGRRGRLMTGADSLLGLMQCRTDRRIALQEALQGVIQHIVHPSHGLFAASLFKGALSRQTVAMLRNLFPELVETFVGEARYREHRRLPSRMGGCQQMQGGAVFGGGAFGAISILAISLVDRENVRDFDNALFDALELVAAAWQQEHQEDVDHVGNGDFGLADADRLDDDDVETGGLGKSHRLSRFPGNATEGARC